MMHTSRRPLRLNAHLIPCPARRLLRRESRRAAASICRSASPKRWSVRRALCLALIFSLLSTSAPAAPVVALRLASELNESGAGLWFHIGRWLASWQGARASQRPEQEGQPERDLRVAKIEISPRNAEVKAGETVTFAATAYDRDGNPVGGVRFKWQAEDADSGRGARISKSGVFMPRVPGAFRIIAEGAGQRAQVMVKARGDAGKVGNGQSPDEKPVGEKQVSTRELTPDTAARSGRKSVARQSKAATRARSGGPSFIAASYKPVKAAGAMAPPPIPLTGDEWDNTNYQSSDDPRNRRGDPPDQPSGDNVGSGSYQAAAPVLELPGRGINLQLRLTYNANLWNRSGTQINYDIDRDWPAPGWSLGFGKIIQMGASGSMIVDSDGTRHSFNGSMTFYANGASAFTGHTTDSTFIDYTHNADTTGVIFQATAKYPDGTIITYGAPGRNAVYPTRLLDPNGNYITVTYVNNSGPQIQTVTDTLGRTVNFYYDANGLLTAINGPGLGGATRTLVRLHYRRLALAYSFSGLTPHVRDTMPWVVDAIFYPATRTGYWFGDSDSYSSYGMITKFIEQRIMADTAVSLNEQGSMVAGMMTTEKDYNYPPTSATTLTDVPLYTTMTEQWAGMDTPPAVTTYSVQQDSSPRTVTVVLPDGTRQVQYSYNAPGQFNDGLVYQDETYDSAGKLWHRSSVTWEKGDYDSVRPLRQETTDENFQTTAEEFRYGLSYNQVTEVRAIDYNGALLRKTVTQYETNPAYQNRHILNLVSSVSVYDGDEATRRSYTEYQYDGPGSSLRATPGVTMHSDSYDPYDPQYWVPEYCYQVCYPGDPCYTTCDPGYWASDYDAATDYRGNVTRVVKYADAVNLSGAVVETNTYDITGNKVTSSSSCCDLASFNYGSDTQYAYQSWQSRGSSDPNSATRVTTSATYDFSTGLTLTTTDANGRSGQMSYVAASLRPLAATLSTGATTSYGYDDNQITATETVKLADGTVASTNIKRFDGHGQVEQEQVLAPDGGYDVVSTEYDEFGRVTRKSRPYRSGQPQYYSVTSYDALGRVTQVVAPDGSVTKNLYSQTSRPPGSSTEPGQTVLSVDAWGRERWERKDALGRVVELAEPAPWGKGSVSDTGAFITLYKYNALDNLTEVLQGAQRRAFRYDALGRLTHQKLAEAGATLDDAGKYVGNGQWSHVFAYDDRSNLISAVDARGVKTIYSYNNDPLNRLQSVTYDTTGLGDTANPPEAAAAVSYQYVTSGDLTKLYRVTAAGVSTEEYGYDLEGRLSSKTVTLVSRPAYPFNVQYVYDTLNRVTDLLYPSQYGAATANKTVHQDYDSAGQLAALKVNGAAYGSQITYNPAGQITSLLVGPSGANQIQETYAYDDRTGLMSGQKFTRAGVSLLDYSYDYFGASITSGRTGQLKKITNNLDASRSRTYEYDALGRLTKATGGSTWMELYTYDRYGNRATVSNAASTFLTSNGGDRFVPAAGQQRQPGQQLAYRGRADENAPAFLRPAEISVSDSEPVSPLASPPLPTALPDAYLKGGRAASARGSQPDADALPQPDAPAPSPTPAPTVTPSPQAKAQNPQQQSAPSTQTAPPPTCIDCTGTNAAPFADPGGPYAGVAGQPIQFNGSNSYDPDGFVNSYSWNFGDGTTSTLMNPTHAYASAGSYTVSLRVRDNLGAYSSFNYTTATVSNPLYNGATFVSQTVPTSMSPGRQYTITVTMKNSGTKTWTTADMHRLGSQNPQDNATWGVARVNVPASVAPGQSVTFNFTVTAPSAAGAHNFQWRMLQEGVEWFGDYTPNVSVFVGAQMMGNCVGSSVPCDGASSLTYDDGSNRVNWPGWQYDAAGNQTRAQRAGGAWQRFVYDAAGRLVRVKDDAGNTLAIYRYGAGNERLLTQEGSDTSNQRTYYAWGDSGIIAEYVESDSAPSTPAWNKSYVYLNGRLLATLQPGGGADRLFFYHPDQLGTRLISDSLIGTVSEQVTLPFGNELSAESTTSSNRRFTSYDRSPSTGLDYAVNRHYDPWQGRFTQADPVGMRAASLDDPQSLNLYAYCGNDPVNRLDPDGLFSLGRIFKKIGKFLSKAGTVIAKVLHSRWVMIGVAIFSIFFPPLLAFYQTLSEYASILKITGLVLQQKWKELAFVAGRALLEWAANKAADFLLSKVENFIDARILHRSWITVGGLTSCARALLQQYFPGVNLNAMRIYAGLPWLWGTKNWGGFTYGNRIYIAKGQYTPDDAAGLGLVAHELEHTQQYRKFGTLGFLARYVVQVVRFGYPNAPFEKQGAAKGVAVENDIIRNHGTVPCAADAALGR